MIKVKYNREFSSKESSRGVRNLINCTKSNAIIDFHDDCRTNFVRIDQWNSTNVYFVLNFSPTWSDDESSTLKVARVLTNTSRSLIKSLAGRENEAIKIGSHDIQTPAENSRQKSRHYWGVDFNEHLVNDVLDDTVIELGWGTLEQLDQRYRITEYRRQIRAT